jgi:hypothetical protein
MVVGQVSGVRVERPDQSESWDPVAVGTGKWQQNNPTTTWTRNFPRKSSPQAEREREREREREKKRKRKKRK